MMPTWIRVATFALATAQPFTALAVDREAALVACRAEADDTRRLACYDRVVQQAAAEPAAAPAGAPPAAAPPVEPELSAEERFGRGGSMAREESDRKKQESRDLGELAATVTSIQTRGDGLMVFTLDNGQVWTQNRPDSLFRLKEGDAVKIQPGALNSFILSGPTKRSTRVTRLQ